jgi:UDP-GlcNAc:undecaprenyl-phosphate GlcNAc-1-phosphate transferase
MKEIYFLFPILMIISLCITPIIRKVALTLGMTDEADGDPLKIHGGPVALFGGLAVLATVWTGLIIWHFWSSRTGGVSMVPALLPIFLGGTLVFLVGAFDDVWKVKPAVRLLAHFVAAVIVVSCGAKLPLTPVFCISGIFSVLYIIGAVNAFNIIDGMDGLCAGLSLISCAGFFVLGLMDGNVVLTGLAAIMFAAILGFLPYNFHPAKIFLGDAGSGFIGFMLGIMVVMATSASDGTSGFIVPLLIIGIPVGDVIFAIVRRILSGKPVFDGDRSHIYDLLLRKGLSQKQVWSIMCGAALLLVSWALILNF